MAPSCRVGSGVERENRSDDRLVGRTRNCVREALRSDTRTVGVNRVQRCQLRGGGCVWQASEFGQDGFQDFDRLCRHAKKLAAFTPKRDLRCLRFLLFNPSRTEFQQKKAKVLKWKRARAQQSNLSIRGFTFPCNLRAACLRKCFDVLCEFGRLDLVPLLSIRRRVSSRIEWLSSAVHSRSGSHSAHGRARQTALELPQPVPRRDRRPDGGSPAPRL